MKYLKLTETRKLLPYHGLLEETGRATPNLCKIKCGPTFELPILVLNLGIFRQTFFSRSLEMNLVLREKVIFFLRTTPAALGRVLLDQVVFSPKTASCFEWVFSLHKDCWMIFLWSELVEHKNTKKNRQVVRWIIINKQRNGQTWPILALKFTIYHKIDLFATAWGHFWVSAKIFDLSGHFYRIARFWGCPG